MDSETQTLVDNWIKVDRDEKSLALLQKLIDDKQFDKLKHNLNPKNRLEFGTAGLRGEVAPGYCCMNTVVIMQTAQGICKYVQDNFKENLSNGICICYDARHYSDVFGEITAGVFIAAGIPVHFFKQLSPTPYAAYFSEILNCVAGVMVTASHNPSCDNGYKVYGMNRGVQIVPPHDSGIQAAILTTTEISASTYNYKQYLTPEFTAKNLYNELTEASPITQKYYDAIRNLCFFPESNAKINVQMQFSAMWGVGFVPFQRAAKTFNFAENSILHFSDSAFPDPNFGGEKRPNPEERHNMLQLAAKADKNTKILLVNDPDADRFALAEKQPNGEFYVFHGNEIGAILAEWMLENTQKVENRAICCSTVSSQILKKMADFYGVEFAETLTGFKWLATQNLEWKKEGKNCVFAFEEAIGYSCGAAGGLFVGDKDGVATACVAAEMCNQLYGKGMTVLQYMHQMYQKYGFYAWNNTSISVGNMAEVEELFSKLINGDDKFTGNGRKYAWKFGQFEAIRVRDMKSPGFDSETRVPKLPVGGSEMLSFYCGDVSCTFRPSGTEPKVKCYVESVSKVSCEDAQERAQEFTREFMKVIGK